MFWCTLRRCRWWCLLHISFSFHQFFIMKTFFWISSLFCWCIYVRLYVSKRFFSYLLHFDLKTKALSKQKFFLETDCKKGVNIKCGSYVNKWPVANEKSFVDVVGHQFNYFKKYYLRKLLLQMMLLIMDKMRTKIKIQV